MAQVPTLPAGDTFDAVAAFVGERIDVRGLTPRLSGLPVVLPVVNSDGWAVVFRYGAVVFFGVSEEAQIRFLRGLEENITHPYETPEIERVSVHVRPEEEEGIWGKDALSIRDATLPRLQLLATALAKSVVLAQYEEAIADVFAEVEPLADDMRRTGRAHKRARSLIKQIGGTLRIQHTMVGRVEVTEKPELLWEHAELERLYLVLEDEYELRERHTALERKLSVISNTAETLLELLQANRSLRVEWYIVILIVVEILITLSLTFLGSGH